MDYRIEITDNADDQIEKAVAWIARDSFVNANRWNEGLIEKIHTLKQNPDRCPTAAENDRHPVTLRELLYGNRRSAYRILFTIEGELVQIIAVRHAARRDLGEQE